MKVRDILQYHQTYNKIYLRKQLLTMVTMVKRMLLSMSQIQCCISTQKAVCFQNVNRTTSMSHKNRRRSINIPSERMDELTATWILALHMSTKLSTVSCKQIVPGWTGFRKLVSLNVSFATTTDNCRTVPASPKDLNFVHTFLRNIKRMLLEIEQSEISIKEDQSIYQISKQIQWVDPSLTDITIRLGSFHIAKTFICVIRKRMKSSGFADILEASKVYKSTVIEGICFY